MRVNGLSYDEEVEPRLLLVHFLRETLGLTGVHVGCVIGECGACCILLDGHLTKACLFLAAQADGREVTTIEGMAQGETLHPVQQAFVEEHGLQCGFCTPGILMSILPFLEENPQPTEDEIRHALSGNLCRCTGYQNIVEAVRLAAERMAPGGRPASAGGADTKGAVGD